MALPILNAEEIQKRLQDISYPAQGAYLAMYSTWFKGIVKDPSHMMIPVDDHIVHRGDGVFEAIKIIDGKAYLLEAHLARLQSSADRLFMPLPMPLAEIRDVIIETSRVAGAQSAMLRLYVSRGPGGFTTNPYDSVGSQMYLIVTKFAALSEQKYLEGVKIGRSQVPPKEEWMAQIKSCNYLSNVMMKKESVDRKIDFTIGFDRNGFITESSTENIVIVDKNKVLVRPKLRQILKGTTMTRTMELAESLLKSNHIRGIAERDLTEADLVSAEEAFMIGTTLDVLPISSYEGKNIGSGKAGSIGQKLLSLLREDISKGPSAVSIF